ncbi:phosphatase PAP2 family protein [Leifsonia sp. C5G2]|uniref:phosphatase PAP2 family protein n=1 Tax=Leifsonia sp. C5G2 TaxID=2735269 RepID=UPI001584B566|nr:phosphatase PAP2 family protein [Leifsonia sp. C5G2]NUU06954.1 phosphatase PAP2 family protein [Leifsonia sp. C5G2]
MPRTHYSTPPADDTGDRRTRLAALPQPQHWLLLSLVGVLAVLALGFATKLIPGVLSTELALDEALTDHQMPVLSLAAVVASTIFSPPGIVLVLVASFVFLLVVRRSPVNAFAFTGLATFGWLCSEIFKVTVAEPRPPAALLDHPLLAESGSNSFPSGHTTYIAAYAIACFLLARRTRFALPVAIVGIAAVAGMAAVRLYVSAHYLTDVLGSVLVAVTAAVFFSGVWNRIGLAVLTRLPLIDRFGPVPTPLHVHDR